MSKITTLQWCSNCLSMSTRPRISFDSRGFCNACQWAEAKQSLDWVERKQKLHKLLDQFRRSDGRFDCVVPVSGGKDGSYVAYNLKHVYGMNPLCITVTPALPLKIGESNLQAFIKAGYNHLSINPSFTIMRKLNKLGLINMGFPYYGWLIAIQAGVVRTACNLGINLIFYGEDGEVEYGGSTETSENPVYDVEYMKRIYLEGGYERVLSSIDSTGSELFFFKFPTSSEYQKNPVAMTHWSYFENWDPYRNYLIAKEHCGLQESNQGGSGTFTNFAQNDQALYALHTYLMYLKFGFGRANQDACIEIRRGAMDRDQAIALVRLFDGQYPKEFEELYLDYYEMNLDDFRANLVKWADPELFDISIFPPAARFVVCP